MGHAAGWLQRYRQFKFKNKIEKWKPENCPCRLCNAYINNIGFVWEQKRNLEYSVALGKLFLLLASFVLLQVHTSFLAFLIFYF